LNAAIEDFVKKRRNDQGLAIRHVVGERFIDTYRNSLHAAGLTFVEPERKEVPPSLEHVDGGLQYQIVGYEVDMASMYAAVDVIVGRGGAGTVAEVAVTGTPAVLIPWSQAADDHQTENVRWLADAGGAIFLSENSCRQELSNVLDTLRQDPLSREQLGRQAYVLGEKNRVGAITALIERVALPQVQS
jgi:UDP-N-acetylglucosamine--N-acetylmuramyl-(pentapeptide) pyrophosphoryl-undecaprenol N-acetylglucosamine transferase